MSTKPPILPLVSDETCKAMTGKYHPYLRVPGFHRSSKKWIHVRCTRPAVERGYCKQHAKIYPTS